MVVYGDVLFRRYILDGLMSSEGDIVVAVDALWENRARGRGAAPRDLVAADQPALFRRNYLDDTPVLLRAIVGRSAGGRHRTANGSAWPA